VSAIEDARNCAALLRPARALLRRISSRLGHFEVMLRPLLVVLWVALYSASDVASDVRMSAACILSLALRCLLILILCS